MQQSQRPGRRRVVGRDTRGRAAEDDDRAGDPSESEGRVDGVIARRALLFVGGLLLLVDDHEPRPLQRCEKRGARADDDVGHPVEDAAPFVIAFAGRERGVQKRDAFAEARHEPRDDLRRERDLRHEDDDAVAHRERARRGTQVDLGLPARRDTVKQERRARAETGDDRPERVGLSRGRGRVAHRVVLAERELARDAAHAARAFEHQTAFGERARRDGGAAGVGEIRGAHRARLERPEGHELARAETRGT